MSDLKEQRICIKFCFKLGNTATETHQMLQKAFGNEVMGKIQTFKWFTRFKNGRMSVEDDEHSGHPSTGINDARTVLHRSEQSLIDDRISCFGKTVGCKRKQPCDEDCDTSEQKRVKCDCENKSSDREGDATSPFDTKVEPFEEIIIKEERIEELAEQAELRLVPKKSQHLYCKQYEKLMKWMKTKNSKTVNERVMLAYMMEMSSVYKSSTLWCMHSKLQTMLRINDGIDLVSFHKLHAFMKKVEKGNYAKKLFVFTEKELRTFFIQACDDTFLFLKIVAICGVFGSCRRYELCDLRLSDIKKEGSALVINIRPSKTEKGRKFAVVDDSNIPYVQLFNKYLSLRPENVITDRVFLKYANGQCTKQVVGINSFGRCPSRVARFLNLPHPEKYTGLAFRQTSATIIDELKRQEGWKATVEKSIVNKIKISERIAAVVNGTSDVSTMNENNPDYVQEYSGKADRRKRKQPSDKDGDTSEQKRDRCDSETNSSDRDADTTSRLDIKQEPVEEIIIKEERLDDYTTYSQAYENLQSQIKNEMHDEDKFQISDQSS